MPKARLELARPCEHYDLNVACIPFHHFGNNTILFSLWRNKLYPSEIFLSSRFRPKSGNRMTGRHGISGQAQGPLLFLGFAVKGAKLNRVDGNIVGICAFSAAGGLAGLRTCESWPSPQRSFSADSPSL